MDKIKYPINEEPNPDEVKFPPNEFTRAIWRCNLKLGHPMVDWFKKIENQIIFKRQFEVETPYKNLQMNVPQELLQSKLDNKLFERFQYVNISAPCASGKTLMGLQMIKHLGLKTLIISCRVSIKEQWQAELSKLWKNIKISIQKSDNKAAKLKEADIYIMSPQYLSKHLEEVPQDVYFVIFDEIHSMCGDNFGKCLKIYSYIKHPIYMCGLSATYPEISTEDGQFLYSIFGAPIVLSAEAITKRTVYVYDFRDKTKDRGNLDQNWRGLTINQVVKRVCDGIEGIPRLETFNPSHKILCVSEEVKDSLKCCKIICNYFESIKDTRKFAIIRESTKGAFIISSDKVATKGELTEDWIIDNCEKITIPEIDNSDVSGVFGCNARLKEGINIKTLAFGISTNFNYSVAFRVQLLGRIRRTNDPIKRFFVVNSGKAPNDGKYWGGSLVKYATKITYSFKYEEEQFKKNGIIRI